MRPSLKNISWQVDEFTYREDKALSYSTLAKYAREGFNNIDHLFDKVESPSLTFGSVVDTILTGGYEEFEEKYFVGKFPQISDSILKVVKFLHDNYSDCATLKVIPTERIIEATELLSYQLNWKPETRAKVLREKGDEYYCNLAEAGDRIVISADTYKEASAAVDILKTSEATKEYFRDKIFDRDIEDFYQLKFKATLDNVDYRCMADLLRVNHEHKTVTPIDLKTSSKPEWDFFKSFLDWSYHIQARLYWRIIRHNMDKDPYFKDFKLNPYLFIVVNKSTLTPLVWEFEDTAKMGALYYGKDRQIELKDPFYYGRELSEYLKNKPAVPKGIKMNITNKLSIWLNTL